MKGMVLSQSEANTVTSSGDNNEGKTINRISVNAVDFPMTNIPYSNYEVVKFIYEIYERVLLSVYYDRLTKPNSAQLSVYKTLSDLEVSNIRTSLTSTSPSLTKILKDVPFTPDNILVFLRNFSNDGTGPSWQQFIRGEFTSEYMRTITSQDYSILNFDTLTQTTPSTVKTVDSYSSITQYLKSSLSTSSALSITGGNWKISPTKINCLSKNSSRWAYKLLKNKPYMIDWHYFSSIPYLFKIVKTNKYYKLFDEKLI